MQSNLFVMNNPKAKELIQKLQLYPSESEVKVIAEKLNKTPVEVKIIKK